MKRILLSLILALSCCAASAVDLNIKTFGAKCDGITNDASAIQATLNAVSTSGGQGGTVYAPSGACSTGTTTITVPSRVKLVGQGPRSTIFNYAGTAAAFKFDGTDASGLIGVRIGLGSSGTAIGISLVSTSGTVRKNRFQDLEIAASSAVAGQIGIKVDGTTSLISENRFDQIDIVNLAKPILNVGGNVEGNLWNNISLQDYGVGASPAAVDGPTNAEQYTNLRIAGVTGGVTTPIGVRQTTGSRNYYHMSVDIGAGSAVSDAGTYNRFEVQRAAGTTPLGTIAATSVVIDPDASTFPSGTWTPADASGAGLVLTVTSAEYVKVGQMVYVTADITYPATASGATAVISGLPFTSKSTAAIVYGAAGPSFTTAGANFSVAVNTASTTLQFYSNAGASKTNANLTGAIVRLAFWYRASS